MKRYQLFIFYIAIFFVTMNYSCSGEQKEVKVIFIGDSITEFWVMTDPHFFMDNDYVGKGLKGEVVPQFLSRFEQDVISLKPLAVVIHGGVNDIAENSGTYDPDYTLECIKSMAEKADQKGIKVILASLLPVDSIHWNKNITNVPEKILALNENIRNYAASKGFWYVDYYSQMIGEGKAMPPEYTYDGVHVTLEGYKVMEAIVMKAIDEAIIVKKIK